VNVKNIFFLNGRTKSNSEVLAKADATSKSTILIQSQWVGHVARMSDQRISKILLSGELQSGKCSHGGHKKYFKDSLKTSLKSFDININTWEDVALDRQLSNRVHWHMSHPEKLRVSKDSRKVSQKSLSIDVDSLEILPQNHLKWHGSITSGVYLSEERRKTEA
jgi:hypothetical protein